METIVLNPIDIWPFIVGDIPALIADPNPAPASKLQYIPTINEIPISRVTYSGNATTVFFTDGTKTTVRCSSNDTYDRQTAIAYALVKRLFGKIGRYDAKTKRFYENEIDGNGLGLKLEKIAAAGFDQDLEKKNLNAKKAEAKAAHVARQKAEHEAAWQRRVAKRAEEIRLERDANAYLDSLSKTKKPLNESACQDYKTAPTSTGSSATWQNYTRPDKPFSQFTSEEKKAYWRAHNAKRRALGK
jgi:hypothetical protein